MAQRDTARQHTPSASRTRSPRPSGFAWLALAVGLVLAACGGASSSATPSGGVPSSPGAVAGGGGQGGGAQGGDQGGAGASGPSTTPVTPPPSQPESPSPTVLPDTTGGPYAVKQIETLGGESVTGGVCDTTKPFAVSFVTPRVSFVTAYTPRGATRGTLSYAYSIPSAGESHQATGTYTITGPTSDGTLHVAETVSDHVVFKGFDGKMPVRYKFDLVPAAVAGCPGG